MPNIAAKKVELASAVLCAMGMLLIPLALLLLPQSDAVAVIGAPGSRLPDVMRLVAEADGVILRGGGVGNLVVARSERSGFVGRLYAAGAWLVLNPIVAGGCEPLVDTPTPTASTRTLTLR